MISSFEDMCAVIGYVLHFTYSDILRMDLVRIERFYEKALKIKEEEAKRFALE